MGLHEDDWGKKEAVSVLSVVKEIQGMDMGYVEVQQDKEAIDKMIADSEDGIKYLFMTQEGDLIYTNDDTLDSRYFYDQMKEEKSDIKEIKNGKGEDMLCVQKESGTQI